MKDGPRRANSKPPLRSGAALDERGAVALVLQERVDQLIHAYRVRGHLLAQLDPLGRPRPAQPELDLPHYGIQEEDLDRPISGALLPGPEVRTVRYVLDR